MTRLIPTVMRFTFCRLFAREIAVTDVWYFEAMIDSVSPRRTVCAATVTRSAFGTWDSAARNVTERPTR